MLKQTLAFAALATAASIGLTGDVDAAGKCKQKRTTAHTASARAAAAPDTIVGTAVSAGAFETLVTAVKAAGLVEALSGEGPFTVFAPTDEAFAKLPDGTIEALLEDTEKLAAILKYHVVAGNVMAADVVELEEAETLIGQTVKVDTSDGVKINDANVVKTDIKCSNGVIHVIDTVLIPAE